MFKPKLPGQNKGFTLVEVLVAILIMSVFIAVALEAIVIATVVKTRARQIAEATIWIQEDLEKVKSKAMLPLPSTTLTAAAGSALVVASVDGFELGDKLMVGTDTINNEIQSIVPSTLTITLKAPVDSIQPFGAPVVVIKSVRCTPPTPSTATGFGDYLQDKLPALSLSNPNTDIKSILNKPHTLTRTSDIKDVAPFEVLKLTYSVAPQDAHTTLTNKATATSTTLKVVSANGFQPGDKLTVGTDTDNTIKKILSVNTIELTSNLGSDQPLDAVVDASIAITSTEVIPDAAFQCP